jgi:hypothetical protein
MRNWKYRLDAEYTQQLPIKLPAIVRFCDENQNCWATIGTDGVMSVIKGYSWDGCSPKWRIGDVLIGTPDGAPDDVTGLPKTYFGSLVHDVLCQFEHCPDMPFTRLQIDRIFRDILQRDRFAQAQLYYAAVRVFAWVRVL